MKPPYGLYYDENEVDWPSRCYFLALEEKFTWELKAVLQYMDEEPYGPWKAAEYILPGELFE